MQPSRSALTLRFIAVDVIGGVLYFPVWWYTAGAFSVVRWCWRRLAGAAASFGIGIWLKNLFTPMYGQRDIASRLISFFMRLLTVVFYAAVLLVLAAFLSALAAAWFAVPAFVAWQIALQSGAAVPSAI